MGTVAKMPLLSLEGGCRKDDYGERDGRTRNKELDQSRLWGLKQLEKVGGRERWKGYL